MAKRRGAKDGGGRKREMASAQIASLPFCEQVSGALLLLNSVVAGAQFLADGALSGAISVREAMGQAVSRRQASC